MADSTPAPQRDATVSPATVAAAVSVPMVSIALSTKLWYHWLDIETRNVVTAEAEQGADDLAPELQASLIAIASAAFCLDAIYAEVKRIHPDTTTKAGRAKSIAHTILQGFNLKDGDQERLRADILWLFEARDMGVHHGEEARPTVPHPHPNIARLSGERPVLRAKRSSRRTDRV